MEIRAIAKSVRMSPRKVRLVADMIRPLSIDSALLVLAASQKRAAEPLIKLLKSAVANAVNNSGVDRKSLVIQSLEVTDGQALKRFHPSTRGRVHAYKRRSSNIKIILKVKELVKQAAKKIEEKKVVEEVKSAPLVAKKEKKQVKKGEDK